MIRLVLFTVIFQFAICQQYQQKVAPGVPPQNYQNYQQAPPPQQQQQYQQPPQQQYQQQPPQQQYQPPPQQQQQQQQQQYQQQVPVQQIPVQQNQGHGHDPHLLDAANIAQEREHIQEHMEVPIDTSKMSEQELQFHYFKMHDSDNNNKLDGCELIKSLIHWHGQEDVEPVVYTDAQIEATLDLALNYTDINNDGYIDYTEYRFSMHRTKVNLNTTHADGKKVETAAKYKDEDLSEIVEGSLKQADKNNDGFIDWPEFRSVTIG